MFLVKRSIPLNLKPLIESVSNHWTFLGVIPPLEMSAFFHSCEVTVLPSVNSTESYGMVQVESMKCGTPVVASNIPGVRVPVRETGTGLIVPQRDGRALAEAIVAILNRPDDFQGKPEALLFQSMPENFAINYESLFQRLAAAIHSGRPQEIADRASQEKVENIK